MPDFRYLIGPRLVDILEVSLPVAEPHPTTFEYEEWHFRGTGAPVRSGVGRVVWTYEGQYLSAVAWAELQSLIGSGGYGLVYIRTRTENIEADEYEYEVFQAIMSRPQGRPVWGERFADVSVEFLIIENPAKGFDPNAAVNVTVFPGWTPTTSTSSSTTSTSMSSTSTTTSMTYTSTTVTSTSTTTTSTSTTSTVTSSSTSTTITVTSTTTTMTVTSTTTTMSSTSTTTSMLEYEVLELPDGCEYPISMAVDETYGHVYVGCLTSPGRILLIRSADFTVVKVVTLQEGEDFPYAMCIDTFEGFLYVGTYTDPAKVVKLGLAQPLYTDFIRLDAITL